MRLYTAAQKQQAPMIVYFNTKWCTWCLKLNKKYLQVESVRAVLDKLPKVSINPEDGKYDDEIFTRLGGSGYPTFLILMPDSSMPIQKLSPFGKVHQTPEAFAISLRQDVARAYEASAYDRSKKQDCRGAIERYQMALDWGSDAVARVNANMGHCYHQLAAEARDIELLRRAATYYELALQADPQYEPARTSLEKVRALLAAMPEASSGSNPP